MSEHKNILIIEDDAQIAQLLALHIQSQNYAPTLAQSVKEARDSLNSNHFDLILLDRMLPDINGLEFCRELKSHQLTQNIPLIFITALTTAQNIIEGLDAGADDYISKPFDLEIVSARIRSLLRRTHSSLDHFKFKNVEIKNDQRLVLKDDLPINLTTTEFDILWSLVQSNGSVLSRNHLIEKVFGSGIHVTGRTIDTHMVALRKKLQERADLIITIRGVGYRFNVEA